MNSILMSTADDPAKQEFREFLVQEGGFVNAYNRGGYRAAQEWAGEYGGPHKPRLDKVIALCDYRNGRGNERIMPSLNPGEIEEMVNAAFAESSPQPTSETH
jgi:hypothetical protein